MKAWVKKIDIPAMKINSKYLFLIPVIILLFGIRILEGGTYTDSAHGDSSYGVDRVSTDMYTKGHCAHCHEQHASIDGQEPLPTGGPDGYLLFDPNYTDQTTNFCIDCHDNTTTYAATALVDRSYSYKFGGDTSLTCPSSIKEAFSFITESGVPQTACSTTMGSAHQLTDVRNFLIGKWGFGSTNADITPCSGCHNPHKAQRHNYPVSMGTSPLSLPTAHDGNWNVYGADTTERMNHYTYQAPYYYSSTITYEPDGNSIADGSNMPDYVAFCTSCHDTGYNGGQMTSTQKSQFTSDVPIWIQNPNWNASPHGAANGDQPDATNRKAPYTVERNYVLSCTDCHESHGSPNRMLIRKEVNGESPVTFTVWNDRSEWLSLCQRCHTIASDHESGSPCHSCHTHDPSCSNPF
jgi:hypothetical protein